MEKQTKILLGLGAVIAAYLILKPKKAVAAAKTEKYPNDFPDISKIISLGLVRCGDGTMQKKEDCATRGGYNTGPIAELKDDWASILVPKGPCVCITAPCNC